MSRTIHFIVPYPKGKAPSQRFRFEQYLNYLNEHGFEVKIHSFHTEKSWNRLYSDGNTFFKITDLMVNLTRRKLLLFRLIFAQHIFMHREMAHIGPPIFEWILAKVWRKKYVYDFDDAIWLPNYSETNARFQKLKAYWKVNYCMKWASSITAGNDYLANYAKQFNKNVQVIPTTIDTENHHNQTTDFESEKVVIGWTGTHTTMHYLDEIVPIIEELEKHYSFEFRIISNEAPTFHLKSLKYIPWSKETEIDDLAKINIGIMPLKEDQWSNGKCGFKALQYMSLGIVTIASPVGVNSHIIQDRSNGILASTMEEWQQSLEELLKSSAHRKELGLKGQQTVIEKYSVLANQDKYLNLFTPN